MSQITENSIIVVTGASRGLGLSIATEATARGFRVEAVGRDGRSRELPQECVFSRVECNDPEQTSAYWECLLKKYGNKVSVILINNAGTYHKKPFEKTDFAIIKQCIEDNYYTAANMTKSMMAHYETGRIVNIVSTTAIAPGAGKSAYGAAKAAERAFFTALREECGGTRYRITNVFPGPINTWSSNVEDGCMTPGDLSKWVMDNAVIDCSFELAEAVVLPFK